MGQINITQSTQYRWFKTINESIDNLEYLPFSLNDTIQLESAYLTPPPQSLKLNNINVNFTEMKYNSFPIIRQQINQISRFISGRSRYLSLPFTKIIPYKYDQLSNFRLFFYNELFSDISIDNFNLFIINFVNHISLFSQELITFLSKNFKEYLITVHNIKNIKFSFESLKQIILKDFSSIPLLKSYNKYYLENMTQNTLLQIIESALSEEGDLFFILNHPMENVSICMFYLLVTYIINTKVNQEDILVVYKKIESNQIDMVDTFKPGNILITTEYLSTTKNQQKFKKDNRIEITIENTLHKYSYLGYHYTDISVNSLFKNEGECIIQPHSIMEVNDIDIDYETNCLIIKLSLKTNFFADFIPFQLKNATKIRLGICDNSSLIDNTTNNSDSQNYVNNNMKRVSFSLNNLVAISLTSLEQINSNISSIGLMKNLISLDLTSSGIKDNELILLTPYISNLSFLQYLNLSQNSLTFRGISELVQTFKILPMLSYLNLNQNELGDRGIIELSKGIHLLQNLHTLNLVYNKIKYQGLSALGKKLYHLNKLHVLNLSSNFIFCEEMDDLISSLDNMPLLNYLNLSNNQILTDGLVNLSEKLIKIRHLQHLNLSENCIKPEGFISFMNNVHYCPNMLSLIFYGNQIGAKGVKQLAANLHYLPNLRALNLGFNLLNDDEMVLIAREMENMPEIQILNFRENSIGQRGILEFNANLYKIPKLTSIDFSWNQILYEGLESFLAQAKNVPNLISMNFEYNPIRMACMKTFLHELKGIDPSWILNQKGEFLRPNNLHSIEDLMVKYIQMNDDQKDPINNKNTKHNLQNIEKYIQLNKLDLSKQKIGLEGMKYLNENISKLTKLTSIDLRCNELDDEGTKQLCFALKSIPSLLHLNLRENNIGVEGIKALSENYIYFSFLQTLNLSWNQIGDEGMKYLSKCNFPNLESIKLRENGINAEGVGYFAGSFEKLIKLKHLDLCWNIIGAKGLDMILSQINKLCQLRTLNLGRNNLKNQGLALFCEKLKEMQNLESLYLFNNSIEDNGASNFLAYFEEGVVSITYFDLSQNNLTEEIKQKFWDIGIKKQISFEL